jgi:hypothetical protein
MSGCRCSFGCGARRHFCLESLLPPPLVHTGGAVDERLANEGPVRSIAHRHMGGLERSTLGQSSKGADDHILDSVYKTTSISELDGNDNPMIGVISGWTSVSSDPAGVVAAVKAALKQAAGAVQVPSLPPDVQALVELGRGIFDIRAKPPLNKSQSTGAAKTLADLPPALMALLEPDTLLQSMCQQVVLAIIAFSKLGPGEKAKQRKVFLSQIAALQAWVAQPGIRNEILKNPINC